MRTILAIGAILILFNLSCDSAPKEKDAVAKVNNRYIPVETLEKKISRVASLPGKDFSSNEKKREVLDDVINQELLFQAALKEGILDKSERIKNDLSREYLRQKIGTQRYEPTEDELKGYYDEKKESLERIRASHILIKPKKPGDEASELEAKKKAEKLLADIRKGADFAKVAREHSEDLSNKNRGGDLFYFERAKMVPEFSNVAFSLQKVGDVSEVVKTKFGYHIIKLTGEQRGLDFFKHSIKWQIAQKKRKEQSDKLFKELRKKASVKVYDKKLAQVEVKKTKRPSHPRGLPGKPPVIPQTPKAPQTGKP